VIYRLGPVLKELFISIIMPSLNEDKTILHAINDTLEAFDYYKIKGEIIVVNDGSTDRTREIVENEMKNIKRVRLINHEKPHGIGASFWEGVNNASGNAVSMFPGDNENDPMEIFRYTSLLDNVDIIVPFTYNKEIRSKFRRIVSYFYHKIVNNVFNVSMNYTNGTVVYRKRVIEQITNRETGYFYQTDILIRLIRNNYLFAEVPYKLRRTDGRKTKAISIKNLIEVIAAFSKLFTDIYFTGYKKEILKDSATGIRLNK